MRNSYQMAIWNYLACVLASPNSREKQVGQRRLLAYDSVSPDLLVSGVACAI